MTQRSEQQNRKRRAAEDRFLANRLDRLDRERLDASAVEKVISRAIELESEDPGPSPERYRFTPDQVENIAGELGIEAEFIRRAITEVQTAPPPDQRSKLDRRFLPEPLVESSAIEDMTTAEVERLLSDWMVNREGMRLIDRFDGGGEWEVDPHWMTKLRTSLNSDSGRLSRVAPGPIRHQVDTIGEDKHVIALEASEKMLQALGRAGIGLAGLVTFAFWLIAFFAALGSAGPYWTIAWLVLGGLVGAGIFASVTSGIRAWGRRIKRRLRSTLFRIINREEPPPGSKLGDLLSNLFSRAP